MFGQATVILLDQVVGEYDAVMKIHSLAVEPIGEAVEGEPLKTLTELPTYLGTRK